MRWSFMIGWILALSSASIVYGSQGPLQVTVSQDGRIEIINLIIDDYLAPGLRVSGGDWQALELPENLAGYTNALSGNGDIVCGTVSERGSIPTELRFRRAVIWRNDNISNENPLFSFYELPLLPTAEYSSALNISENGKYIVGVCQESALGDGQACYWDGYGVVHDIGTMTYDSFVSDITYPHSVSNNNVIVGTAISDEAGYQAAFIWDQVNGMRYLKDVLEADYGYDFAGCILSQAFNISPDGRVIDGYGYDNHGNYFDWVVTIPEPASLLLLGLGGVSCFLCSKTIPCLN